MSERKYVVFKAEDWEAFLGEDIVGVLGGESSIIKGSMIPAPIEDAVVIRRQDVFSPPALDAYANSIDAALTIVNDMGHGVNVGLRDIADYFHEQAVLAWQTDRKIPD